MPERTRAPARWQLSTVPRTVVTRRRRHDPRRDRQLRPWIGRREDTEDESRVRSRLAVDPHATVIIGTTPSIAGPPDVSPSSRPCASIAAHRQPEEPPPHSRGNLVRSGAPIRSARCGAPSGGARRGGQAPATSAPRRRIRQTDPPISERRPIPRQYRSGEILPFRSEPRAVRSSDARLRRAAAWSAGCSKQSPRQAGRRRRRPSGRRGSDAHSSTRC